MLGPGAPSGLQVHVLPHHLIQQLAGEEGIAARLPITHCTHACTKTSRACNRHGRICDLQLVQLHVLVCAAARSLQRACLRWSATPQGWRCPRSSCPVCAPKRLGAQ